MKKIKLIITITFMLALKLTMFGQNHVLDQTNSDASIVKALKEAYKDKFLIGTTLNARQLMGGEPEAINVTKKHFNSIVAENVMKSARIRPSEEEFDFGLPDKFVEFGEENNMHIHGHTLIWHSQAPDWFFVDEEGETVSKEVLIQRMKEHIHTLVGRYKGRIHGM